MTDSDPSLAFLRDLLHELNDPFAAIHGGLQLLPMLGSLPQEQRTQLEGSLLRNSKVLRRVLEDASAYLRLAAGAERPPSSACDLSVLLREALEQARPSLETREQSVEGLPESALPIQADAALLRSCLSCLLLSLSRGGRHGTVLDCQVSQSATGISIEITGDGSVKQGDYRATLLGLMVESLAGRLLAVSQVGRHGWLLELPLSQAQERNQSLPPSQPGKKDATALVVEDNSLAGQALVAMLSRLGVRATCATSAETALAMLGDSTPDIILCDLGLPGDMDGNALAAYLRERESTKTIPLIAVTGDTSASEPTQCAHFDRVVVKPLDVEGLRKLLLENGLTGDDR